MNKFFLILLFCACIPAYAQEYATNTKTLLLTGASFANPVNGWFEIACRSMGKTAINRAIGGKAIADTANQMAEGTLYSPEELEQVDAFVIMHTHNRDVFDESNLKNQYTDYTLPLDRSDYAAAYDYVIKRYISDCYALKDNPASAYYGTTSGKVPIIILCTHWHNGRPLFNASIRRLAEKWGFPLVEFDSRIGFNAQTPHPVTGASPSLLYAQDRQETNGVTYGWHPRRGEGEYIQQKMAAIFRASLTLYGVCD